MKMHLGRSLIFFMILFTVSIQQTEFHIGEEDFTELEFLKPTKIRTNDKDKEIYLKFNVENIHSDCLFQLTNGKAYGLKLFFFINYENIIRKYDESTDSYTYTSSCNEGEFNLGKYYEFNGISTNEELRNTFYLIIQDTNGFFFEDYITFIEEGINIPIQSDVPYVIHKFLSRKEFKFEFSIDEKETIEVTVIREYVKSDPLTKIVKVTDEGTEGEEVIESSNKTFNYKIENPTETTKYRLIVSTNDNLNSYKKTIVQIYKRTSIFEEINQSQTLERYVIGNHTFYFKLNLDDYGELEQNILTIGFSEKLNEEEISKSIIADLAQSNGTDEELLGMIPKETKFPEENNKYFDSYYHVYFKNTENKKSNFLIVKIDFTTELEYFEPKKMTIFVSERFKPKLITDKGDIQELTLSNYIPIIIQYKINKEFAKSYIVYSCKSFNKESILILGNLLDENGLPNQKEYSNFYVNKNEGKSVFTIILFGPEQNIKYSLQMNEDLTVAYIKKDEDNNINVDFEDCSIPKYIIGKNEDKIDNFVYFEDMTDQFKYYYQYVENSPIPIVPIDIGAIEKRGFSVSADYIILKVECLLPGRSLIQILNKSPETTIKKNKRITFKLKDKVKLVLEELGQDEKGKLEIRTGMDIKITGTLTQSEIVEPITLNGYDNILFDINEGTYTLEIGAEDTTSITVTLITDKLSYAPIKKQVNKGLTAQNIVIFFPSDTSYDEIKITLTGVEQSFYYVFEKDFSSIQLIPDISQLPEVFEVVNIEVEKELTLYNPNSLQSESSIILMNYYLAISFKEQSTRDNYNYGISYEYYPKGGFAEFNERSFDIISKSPISNSIFQLKGDSKYLITVHQIKNSMTGFYLFGKEEPVEETISNEYFAYIIDKFKDKVRFQGIFDESSSNSNGAIISYTILSPEETFDLKTIDQYNNLPEDKITIIANASGIYWKKIPDASYYLIYIFKQDKPPEFIDSEIELSKLEFTKNVTQEESDKDVMKNEIENITQYINIIAFINSKYSLRVPYKSSYYYPTYNPTTKSLLWLWIVIGILVLILIVIVVFFLIRRRMAEGLLKGIQPVEIKLLDDEDTSNIN